MSSALSVTQNNPSSVFGAKKSSVGGRKDELFSKFRVLSTYIPTKICSEKNEIKRVHNNFVHVL